MGVWILDLDQSQGHVLRQLVVRAASQRHREGVCRASGAAIFLGNLARLSLAPSSARIS
jgi:hypothetical protein